MKKKILHLCSADKFISQFVQFSYYLRAVMPFEEYLAP